jgi:mevalonate kinase
MVGFGSGKVILCGEQVVVHSEPAVVVSLSLRTRVDVIPFSGVFIIDKRPKHPNYVPYKKDLYEEMAATIAGAFGVGRHYSFVLSGDLPVTSGGIGASAAAAVGIARALAAMLKSHLGKREIMEIALSGEREIHGNPSGIDTTAASLDGILLFQKEEYVLFYHQIAPAYPTLPMLLVDSQKTTNTKETIAAVSEFKKQNSLLWQTLMMEYQAIFASVIAAIKKRDINALGKLLDQNQNLLNKLKLSCCHVERVRDIARNNGALGSKNTGTCRGGLVLVLGRDSQHVAYMVQVFTQRGYFVVDASSSSNSSLMDKNPAADQAS